jgi:DNA repair exonuclease SbcCD nuclease subunit
MSLEGKLGVLVCMRVLRSFAVRGVLAESGSSRNFDYVAMGHLHARIKVAMGKGELAYPGASEVISRTEISGWQKAGKGFYIVDVESSGVAIRDVNLECIRPQVEAKLRYSDFDAELEGLAKSLGGLCKLPLVHVIVEAEY